MKYTMKSSVIEAFKYENVEFNNLMDFEAPDWVKYAYDERTLYLDEEILYITYPSESQIVTTGDYIIKDTKGNIGVVNGNIFEDIYELLD